MRNIGVVYLSWPFEIRVVIWGLLLAVLWRVLGKGVCRLLSVVPWAFKRLFRGIYLILEMPVAALHKRYGSIFTKIDSYLSGFGEKIDVTLSDWYRAWKDYKGPRIGKTFLTCAIYFAVVVCPQYFHWTNNALRFGNTIFHYLEDSFVIMVQKIEWEGRQEVSAESEMPTVEHIEETDTPNIIFIVSGVSTSLLVRDVPNVDEYEVLDRLRNGDQVTWSGQMTFAAADGDHIEPWIRITTGQGIEGWSRLYYLYPESFDDRIFYLYESLIQ